MIPEPCWMFDAELPEETLDALVRMDPIQWSVIAFSLAGRGEPVQ